ncbi:MAG: hypothetical protein IJR60_03950 [Eubacterium sp.]|nr:hypothetical protein [Eubacterium sp.]
MNWIYEKICIPLMLVNNNVYAFLSGILISLSTNIFTTLCFKQFDLATQWHIYLTTLLFAASGAICIYLSTKMTAYQNYIINKKIFDLSDRKSVIRDVTLEKKKIWTIAFLILFLTLIAGTILLIVNYAIIS